MSFYTSIAPYYDMLFPYDESQIAFLEGVMDPSPAGIVASRTGGDPLSKLGFLDVGCGTGTVLSEFTDRFDRLIGIDLDPELLKLAAEKMYPGEEDKVELLNEDMMELDMILREDSFSLITCLGNTLPHLTASGQLPKFFKNVCNHLEHNGFFIFQIINYDRILDGILRGLPSIEKGDVVFERRYSVPKSNGLIDFETVLLDGRDKSEIKNSVELFPVRKAQISEFLKASGFGNLQFYGDFAGNAWQKDSFLLIGVCSK